jgi:hypothetical protein
VLRSFYARHSTTSYLYGLPIEPQIERNVSWLSSTLSLDRGLAKLMNVFSRTLQVHLPFCSCLSLQSTMAMPDCQRLRHRRILLDSELSCPLACMFHMRKRHSALFQSSLCSRQAHPSPFNNRLAHDARRVAHLLRSQQMWHLYAHSLCKASDLMPCSARIYRRRTTGVDQLCWYSALCHSGDASSQELIQEGFEQRPGAPIRFCKSASSLS